MQKTSANCPTGFHSCGRTVENENGRVGKGRLQIEVGEMMCEMKRLVGF